MEKEEFLRLLKKYRAGQTSAEEEKFLHAYYKLLETGADPVAVWSASQKENLKLQIKKDLDSRIDFNGNQAVEKRSVFSIRRLAAAAAVLIVISAGVYLYTSYPVKPVAQPIVKKEVPDNDIAPGGNKAVLTLADGSKVILNDLESGTQINQGNTAISKTSDDRLVYNTSAQQLNTKNLSLTYNTVATPRGGQYMVVLPDGTKVWLNAESSLRFPTAFKRTERRVELAGEAYFEVAKKTKDNKAGGERIPFIVTSGEQQVEVLGTHFNIMAYDDEPAVKTTLLEGSVKVLDLKSKTSNLLKPGQQSSIGKGGQIKITTVNTEEIIAWKNGYFLFNNEPLESIMRKVSKWFDVQIEYKGNTDNLYFGGMVSRSKNISAVLRIMELTGDIHFKIIPDGKERRVIVMP